MMTMRRMVRGVLVMVLALILSPAFGSAEPIEKRVESLEKKNQALEEKVQKLESEKATPASPEAFTKKDRETLELLKAVQKRVQPFGDISVRYHGQYALDDVFTRGVNFSHIDNIFTRADARARLGLKGEAIESLNYMLRLSTGNPNQPSSAWQPLNGSFSKKSVNFDRYFLDWKPSFFKPGQVLLGKFENPVSSSQIIWDADIGLEGTMVFLDAAPVVKSDFIQRLGLGGVFYYLEQLTPDANDEVYVVGPTFQSRFGVAKSTTFTLNLSYYDYHNVDGVAQAQGLGTLIGAQGAFNTSNLTPIGPVNIGGATPATLIGTGFASDFNLINPYLELCTVVVDIPVKVFIDQVWNAGAAGPGSDLDYGLKAGGRIGGTGKPGSPWLEYDFYHIEADAALDAFNEDEIGTNVISHYLNFGVTVAKNVDLYSTLNFTKDLNPFLRGFGDVIGTQIPGIAVPIDANPWMLRSRVFLTVKF